MSETDALAALLTHSLNQLEAVPIRVTGDSFEPLCEPPNWLQQLTPWNLDEFPVLECTLEDFEAYWKGESEFLTCGPWEQDGKDGQSYHLEAQPLPPEAGEIILLRKLGAQHQELTSTLQKARDHLLVHEALEREINKKEFLLHTIVHDLAGPLTSIRGAFHILSRQNLAREQMVKLLEIGVRQTEKQHSMIREILDVFSAEMGALNKLPPDSVARPLQVALRLKEALDSAFEAKGVTLQAEGVDLEVVGDEQKLERVISNLIENALRHVPRGSKVAVSVGEQGSNVRVEISDDGPGVPDEFADQLFKKLAQGKEGKGKAGLGLYFCKLTVESWGGTIGHKPSASGGACFWFELPRPEGGQDLN